MSFAMGEIRWPKNGHDANVLLRGFMLKLLREIDYEFSSGLQDSISFLEQYVSGDVTAQQCSELASRWKGELVEEDSVRDFKSSRALQARLAESVLGIDEDNLEILADELSWFTELLQAGGQDFGVIGDMMCEYFGSYVE